VLEPAGNGATEIPRRFASALALNAAGNLLMADVATAAQGGAYLKMADDALEEEQNSTAIPDRWCRRRI
jgi:hypothetical protein